MSLYIYFKPIYFHSRDGQYMISPRLYDFLVNGHKESDYKMGETGNINLPSGKNTIQVKLSPLPKYYPIILRFLFDKIIPLAKSDRIEMEIGEDKGSIPIYFVCENWSKSMSDEIKRWSLWIIKLILMKKRPRRLMLNEVSQETFYKQEEDPKAKQVLFPKPSPSQKRLIFGEIIAGVLMAVFGIYLYSQPSDSLSGWGAVLFLSGLPSFPRLWGYFSKSILVFSPNVLRFRCILYVGILGVIAYYTWNQPLAFTLSILFIVVYAFVFFKAKRVARKHKG